MHIHNIIKTKIVTIMCDDHAPTKPHPPGLLLGGDAWGEISGDRLGLCGTGMGAEATAVAPEGGLCLRAGASVGGGSATGGF